MSFFAVLVFTVAGSSNSPTPGQGQGAAREVKYQDIKVYSEKYFEICRFDIPAEEGQVTKKGNAGLWRECVLLCIAVLIKLPPHIPFSKLQQTKPSFLAPSLE